jgi:hypothetical protein
MRGPYSIVSETQAIDNLEELSGIVLYITSKIYVADNQIQEINKR